MLKLAKIGPDYDPESFLIKFEWMGQAAWYPQEHWASLLAPLLTGPAHVAYQEMAVMAVEDYLKVKIKYP